MNQTPEKVTEQTIPDLVSVLLDGTGQGREVAPGMWCESVTSESVTGFGWLHANRDAPGTAELLAGLKLDSIVLGALTAEETRPRCTVHEDGLLLVLRGVNLDPGAELEDMVSVRFWITEEYVVGVWLRPMFAIADLLDAIQRGQGPVSPGDFISKLALRLADRAEPLIAALNEQIDALEEKAIDAEIVSRPQISGLRRSAIMLRRYMIPQKDALTTMEIEDVAWLSDRDRSRLREAAERVARLGEDLDAIRDRAQIVQDQLMDQQAQVLNRRLLLLAVISAVFLPLSLIAGLLGMNVGGIPGAESAWGFWIVIGAVLVLAAGLITWLRASGLFR